MNRRDFLRFSTFAAFGTPLAGKAWEKPAPPFPVTDTWPDEAWEGAYVPEDFIFVKPAVHAIGTDRLGIWWKTKEIALGWVEASQDGGATWRRYTSERDGVRSNKTCTHLAVIDDYDSSKPLKYRAIARPIAEFSRFGNVRYSGETIDGVNLQSYYIGAKAYNTFAAARKKKYTGEQYVASGEIAAINHDDFSIVMFNDIHHGLPSYVDLCKFAPKNTALAVFAGDILDHARSPQDFDKHLSAPMSYVGNRLGCLTRFARGNHEMMGIYAYFVRDHVALQDDAFYGAFSIGDNRIVILDTGIPTFEKEKLDPAHEMDMNAYIEREGRWLRKEMASAEWKNAKNRIAFAHIPPYGEKNKDYLRLTTDLYNPIEKDLSLLMAGHWHDARFIPAGKIMKCPAVIGGGPYRKLPSPAKRRKVECPTLSVLSVKSGGLEAYQYDFKGNEIFRDKVG